MSIHFHRHIDKIKKLILSVGAMVEEALQKAIAAVENRDTSLAEQVIVNDREIDLKEIDVEEECLSTLALYQPVANDLRFIIAVLKINRDLERIGDLAVNIAEQAIAQASQTTVNPWRFGLIEMGQLAQTMLKQSLDALVELDVELAQTIRRSDDQVDQLHRNMYQTVEQEIREHPDQVGTLIRMLVTARQIERIADHAVNIAKDVIYLVEGQIVRHARLRAQRQASQDNPSP